MQEILVRAGCFVAIILLGYVLRKIGFFAKEDFKVLSKIVIKITLPAAIVSSFAGKEIDPTMLVIAAIGLGGGIVYMVLAWIGNLSEDKERKSFDIINLAGYNIGNFTLPFVQSFLGPMGVITTSLFDIGNACICLGGSYSIASMVKQGTGFSLKSILRALLKSVAFDCYVVMIFFNLVHISVPSFVTSFAQIIGNANAFVAMLMIGVGFELSGDFGQMKRVFRLLAVRYAVALLLACGCFYFLPFDLEIRQTLMILVFSPIASAAPAFTEDLKGDIGLSSAVNSISILCSIIFVVMLLLFML